MTVDEIVDAYYRKVYKLCLFYLRDPQEAEEVLQEVFIKVLKKYSTFKGESAVYTWVYRIATNTVLNYIKRKKLIEFISFDSAKSAGPGSLTENSHASDPGELLEHEEEHRIKLEILEKCLEELSQREKTAFYLFHYEGLKQKEIAEVMNTSISAVESLVHKGMKKIKRCAGEMRSSE
jgi:RNA polymerase sigma-70 factor (ECF subfamily)